MKTLKIIQIILLTIATNIILSQPEFKLAHFGNKITKSEAQSRYKYDDVLLTIMEEASSNKLYILTETPETRYAFTNDKDYEKFKSKHIVGIAIVTSKDQADEIILKSDKIKNQNLVYFKPIDMFGTKMLLVALNTDEIIDALKFEGFSNHMFNKQTKTFDPVSKEELSKLLEEWDLKYDTKILSIGYSGVTLRMNKLPSDKAAFVQQLNSICPDAIAQVYMSEEKMWKMLELQKIITLWWD